jgi:hypothetical protein
LFLIFILLFVILHLHLRSLSGFFSFPFLFKLVKHLFSIEDEENAFEHFLANVLRRSFVRILSVKLGALEIGLIHFLDSFFQGFIFLFCLHQHFLTMLLDSIIIVSGYLALEGFLDCDDVSLELCEF